MGTETVLALNELQGFFPNSFRWFFSVALVILVSSHVLTSTYLKTWRGPSADLCAAWDWYSARWTPATLVSPDSPVCLLPALRPRNSPSSQLDSLHVFPSLGSLSYATQCQVSENHCFVYFVLLFVWGKGEDINPVPVTPCGPKVEVQQYIIYFLKYFLNYVFLLFTADKYNDKYNFCVLIFY